MKPYAPTPPSAAAPQGPAASPTGVQPALSLSGAGEGESDPTSSRPALRDGDYGGLLDSIIAGDYLLLSIRWGLRRWGEAGGSTQRTPADAAVTEVVPPGNPRANTPAFRAARKEEADGLRLRGTWKVVNVAELPPDATIIKGRFVNKLKHAGTPGEMPKGRFVAQGHKDKDKPFVVHNTPTLRQRSTKVIVPTSAVLDFRVFSPDVNQSYLQSKDRLSRDIYLQPRPEDMDLFGLKEGQCLRLLKPLYGSCDAGDYWGITLMTHIKKVLEMETLPADL